MIMRALLSALRVAALGAIMALLCGEAFAAAPKILPVPAITIYPGDIIRNSFLVDRDFTGHEALIEQGVVDSRQGLVGKLAKRTLLPGAPIPTNAVAAPDAVKNGEKVRVVFREDGLVIETYALALQGGAVGQVISVRNIDSGRTISGVVQTDGSVRVGG
jgi:flagellar basal body P-ring formation protein FlgA